MKTSDFNFELPQELIAQTPLQKRDSSRMLFLDRKSGEVSHNRFTDIKKYLKKGDLLVLNNSRVMPARLFGVKVDSGGIVQFLLLKNLGDNNWETMVKPGRKARPGSKFVFGEELMTGEVLEVLEGGNRRVKFTYNGDFYDLLDQIGEMPLPEYIGKKLEDKERYQTVYSKELGSAAAPTAGLHFTDELLAELESMGVEIAYVTLHVGLGTFRPVKVDDVKTHEMHSEYYHLPQETADKILQAKASGGKVVAVGTTATRTLESAASAVGDIAASSGETAIFIYPGYEFKIIDGLITNFHLPQSTLVMLVSAFAGKENTLNAYEMAIESGYRFYSFGDCMIII